MKISFSRPALRCSALIFVLLAAGTGSGLYAQEAAVISAESAAASRIRVIELKSRAKALRQEAELRHKQESAECRQSVLVNNCLSAARDQRLEKVEEARAIEMEVGTLEREIRRFDLAERRNERARRQETRNLPATVSVEGQSPKVMPAGDTPAETKAAQ